MSTDDKESRAGKENDLIARRFTEATGITAYGYSAMYWHETGLAKLRKALRGLNGVGDITALDDREWRDTVRANTRPA